MPRYCKAYHLPELRRFADWSDAGKDLPDDTLCFVWDDFKVTTSCFDESAVLYESSRREWLEFLAHELQFEVPEDLRPGSAST